MDRFHELRVCRRTVEAGRVTCAAVSLHVSQPAVSRILSGLEARLGVQLLRRTHSGIIPTEAGASLYRDAIEPRHRLAEDEARTGTAARHPLIRVLPDWVAQCPQIFASWPANRQRPLRAPALPDALIGEVPARLASGPGLPTAWAARTAAAGAERRFAGCDAKA